nr:contactin-like; partial [Biomphalaria glabrata]
MSDEEVSSESNPRYSISNGRLTIVKPDRVIDAGVYTCEASNKFGTVLSNPVELVYGYLGQFSNVKPSTVDAVLYMGIDLNCPIPLHNTGLSYNWYKADVQFLRPEFNPQYFLSRNGHLYISEVQASDQEEYYCLVVMAPGPGQVLSGEQPPSRTSLGTSMNIRGENANTYGPDIQNKFPQVFPEVPMVGDDIYIECLAFGRLPLEYRWIREGGQMNPSAYLMDHNRVLVLPKASLGDTGAYTCVVRSPHNIANKTVYLQMKARPFFPYPLRNQHLDEGSSLTWTCFTLAMPKPVYTWYKDGQLLKTDSVDGIKVVRNTLTIEKVDSKKHSGMYQCQASNQFGLSRSSAQLRALSFAPTFLRNPVEMSKQGAVGGNITISCIPEAAPRATIKWLKGGVELGHVKPNGDLELSSLTRSDAGEYTCVATNQLGEAKSSCWLDIQDEIVFSERPDDLEVEQNSTTVLPCKASFDQSKVDVTYEWRFYSHVLDFTPSSDDRAHYVMPEAESGKLYIIAAQLRHAGQYTCLVKSAAGTLSDTAYVTVKAPPGEPVGVHMRQKNSTLLQDHDNVAIWWQDGEVYGYPITKYRLQSLSIDDNGKWKTLEEDVPAFSVITEQYPIFRKYDVKGGLSPGTSYMFRVAAGNDQAGYGPASSEPSKWYHMNNAAPVFAPSNVGGGGGSVGLLRITWDPLPRSQWGAPDVRYIVYYRRQQEDNSNRKWEMSEQLMVPEYHATVGIEYYYTPYEVKVQAINSVGPGPNSTLTVVYSAEDMPSNVIPIFETFEVLNGTAAIVFWKPIPNTREAARGTVFAYQVNYWEEPTTLCLGQNEREALFNRYYGNASSGLLIGMEPEGHYCFNFQFINHAGMGPKTDNYNFNLNLRPPAYYPEYVTVMSHGNDSVRIMWRGVTVKLGEETRQGYKAMWWDAREDIRSAKISVFPGATPTGVLHGVEQNIVYKVRVQGYGIGGDGRKSPPAYFTLEGSILFNPETEDIMNSSLPLKSSAFLLLLTSVICAIRFILVN